MNVPKALAARRLASARARFRTPRANDINSKMYYAE
jgi:hypothetical protein